MEEKTSFQIGKIYRIYDEESKHRDYSFKAFYIGKKPVETPWFMEPQKPEGDIFASTNNKGQIDVYCTLNSSMPITKFFGGFPVSKIMNFKPSKLEQEYLSNKINEWSKKNVA
jgi:hypothetical protein